MQNDQNDIVKAEEITITELELREEEIRIRWFEDGYICRTYPS